MKILVTVYISKKCSVTKVFHLGTKNVCGYIYLLLEELDGKLTKTVFQLVAGDPVDQNYSL